MRPFKIASVFLFTWVISGLSQSYFPIISEFGGAPAIAYAQCGGTERWFVKVGTDPDASNVNSNNVVPITIEGLNKLPNLRDTVPWGDNRLRLPEERIVYKVQGRLVRYLFEDDNDYHLVITDDSLTYTPGGKKTEGLETGTSFIAEIPDPRCVAGKKGDPSVPSQFATQLKDVRDKFEARFPNKANADKNLGGIPVMLTGVLFYDRLHNQTGRAINGVELHPLLDIEFLDTTSPTVPPSDGSLETTVQQLLANPGFEDGVTGWSGTVSDIGDFAEARAHAGEYFAWMGGLGTSHSETLYQNVTIPSSAKNPLLSFWLHIETDEVGTKAHDKLYVQIKNQEGNLIKSLKVYSNLDSTNDYSKQSFDMREFIGKDVRVFLKAVEDNGKTTSFFLDDFALVIQ